jgi:Ca2+-binding EF-hand superfamily protein
MLKLKHVSAVGLLAMLAVSDVAFAEEDGGGAPEWRQRCKDNPQACREAMQRKAEEWWKKVDTDQDGTVSRAEAEANAPRLAQDFDKVDTNGDGKASREELQAARRAKAKEHMQERWQKADTDGDGALSRQEAKAGAPRIAEHFDQLDANGDGKVTPEEVRAARKQR